MTTPSHVGLSRLSRQLYVDFLRQATSGDISFLRFDDFLGGAPAPAGRFALLRHDIDFAPAYSLQLAELEHAAGVASTYFVLVDGQFYNPVASEVIDQVRAIAALGHEVGLHFAV